MGRVLGRFCFGNSLCSSDSLTTPLKQSIFQSWAEFDIIESLRAANFVGPEATLNFNER